MSNELPPGGATPPGEPTTTPPATGLPGAMPPTTPRLSLDDALARIAELEHANKNAVEERDRHRKKLTAYELAEQKAKEAQLSELELAKKQHADLQAEHEALKRGYQERIVRYEVQLQAQKLNILHPEAAARLLDWSELDFDDDGSPKNAKDLLEKLVKHMPELVAKTEQQQQGQQQRANPALPAMNPGRSQIVPPQSGQQPGRPPRLTDVWKRP